MRFDLGNALDVLERTPGILNSYLGGLDDRWTRADYGPETFSPFDVIGHLIHGERTDWMVRVHHIFKEGEATPFSPFDRFAMFEESRGKELPELLDTFERLRSENLIELKALDLTRADLALRGLHPELGPVSLEQVLATWTVHDLNHIAQISRAMSYQYLEEVGPWKAYLGILSSFD